MHASMQRQSSSNEEVTLVIMEEYHANHSNIFTFQRLGYFHRGCQFSSFSSPRDIPLGLQTQRGHDKLNKILSGFAVQSLISLLALSSSSSSPFTSTCLKVFTISTLVLFCSTIATDIVLPTWRFHGYIHVITYISTTLAFTSLASMLLMAGYLWLVYLLGAFLLVVLFHYLCPLPWLLLHINLVWRRALRRQHVQDDHMSLARYNN